MIKKLLLLLLLSSLILFSCKMEDMGENYSLDSYVIYLYTEGVLTSTETYNNLDDLTSYDIYIYNGGFIDRIETYNNLDNLTSYDVYEYTGGQLTDIITYNSSDEITEYTEIVYSGGLVVREDVFNSLKIRTGYSTNHYEGDTNNLVRQNIYNSDETFLFYIIITEDRENGFTDENELFAYVIYFFKNDTVIKSIERQERYILDEDDEDE